MEDFSEDYFLNGFGGDFIDERYIKIDPDIRNCEDVRMWYAFLASSLVTFVGGLILILLWEWDSAIINNQQIQLISTKITSSFFIFFLSKS